MFQAGVLNTWATNWLGPENVRRTKVRWKEQVWPGDVLTCMAWLAAKREVDGMEPKGMGLVDCEFSAVNQAGEVIIRGDAKTHYKEIRSVLDLCQQANIAKVQLATEVNK